MMPLPLPVLTRDWRDFRPVKMMSGPGMMLAERPGSYSGNGGQRPIPERLLSRLWQKRAAREQAFHTDRGLRVRVLYPGRPGSGAGPDFRNALLDFEGVGLVRGDVEIHRRQQDWDAHGHGGDPNYNGVVLHVALETGPGATRARSGREVPVVSLAPLLAGEGPRQGTPAPGLWEVLATLGYPRPASASEMGAALDRAGDHRFLDKSGRFRIFLGEQDPEQTLYEALLEALGYRSNQQPFLALAAAAPYRVLKRAASTLPPQQRAGSIEAWLLRLSGLLTEEEAAGIALPRAGFGRPMSGREWRCFRLRPANHPRRRIAGGARLVDRFLVPGLARGLRELADAGRPRDLVQGLTVGGEAAGSPAYIGKGRAADLAVNVVLPLLHGEEVARGEAQRAQTYLELFHRFGPLQDNELTREMAGQVLDPSWGKVVTTARRQQGLLHLQRLLAGLGG